MRPVGEEEWREFSFSELERMDLASMVQDVDYELEMYMGQARERLHSLSFRLDKVKSAALTELNARIRRSKFAVADNPKKSA